MHWLPFEDEAAGSDMPGRNTDPGSDSEDVFDFDVDAEVTCPYCFQKVTILLDVGSGMAQEYVEDCEVCCRPWRVQVHYDETGRAFVTVDGEE